MHRRSEREYTPVGRVKVPLYAVLPEVLALEVKVSDWKRALAQATRYSVFCHRSMIAPPETVTTRVRNRKEFSCLGVGILSVADSGGLWVARRARRIVNAAVLPGLTVTLLSGLMRPLAPASTVTV